MSDNAGRAADRPRSTLASTFTVAFGSAAVGAFLVLDDLMSAGGPNCEVYCGPGSILLPSALGLLALALWVVAVTFAIISLRTEQSIVLRVVALCGALALPITLGCVWLSR